MRSCNASLAQGSLKQTKEGTVLVRETTPADLQGLLELYTHLHNNPVPPESDSLTALWEKICSDPSHHIIVAEEDGKLVSSCVCVIIPNLTHGQQPYAFVENVVTHADYRKRGLATACLHFARDIALRENCYKPMLLTGSKLDSTLNFYERAGYDRKEKTAFIQRI